MKLRAPIIAGVVSVVAVILAVFLLVMPKMNDVKEAEDEVAQAQDLELSLRSRLSSLKEAERNAPKTNKQIAKIETQVPPTADLPGLLRLLREAADRSAVDFFSVNPGAPTVDASGRFSIISTSINVTGSYFSLEEFLYRLETLPRVGKVMSISVSGQASEAAGGTGAVNLSMQLTAEFYTSDTSAGPGSEPGPSSSTSSSGSSGAAT
ncbi:MAG: type 4a pilus biogenesis protein PilO [Actinomycetota bacterium]